MCKLPLLSQCHGFNVGYALHLVDLQVPATKLSHRHRLMYIQQKRGLQLQLLSVHCLLILTMVKARLHARYLRQF